MIRRTAMLALAVAFHAAPIQAQGVVNVGTVGHQIQGTQYYHTTTTLFLAQILRAPLDAVSLRSVDFYAHVAEISTAGNKLLPGASVPIPDFAVGVAAMPNFDPATHLNAIVGSACECWIGWNGRTWSPEIFSAHGQTGPAWISANGLDLPVVGGMMYAIMLSFYEPPGDDFVYSVARVGDVIEGGASFDSGSGTTPEDYLFRAQFAVPEPGTLMMVLPGLLLVLGAARRQRARQRG